VVPARDLLRRQQLGLRELALLQDGIDGQVLEEKIEGKSAKAIVEFNNYVLNDQRTEQVLLTVRDGLLLIKNKSR
jgi:hypothetical protein